MLKELLEKDVTKKTLEKAKVSKNEFNDIKMLVKFDGEIFLPESDIHLPNDLL